MASARDPESVAYLALDWTVTAALIAAIALHHLEAHLASAARMVALLARESPAVDIAE